MRYGIFSDIHANADALEKVLDTINQEHVDEILCVGDLVGYGAQPSECVERVRNLGMRTVAGNHDWGLVGKFDINYFNLLAKESIYWTDAQLNDDQKTYLSALPLVEEIADIMMVHSLLPHPEWFGYLNDLDKAKEMFTHMDKTVCFVGHTHVPGIIRQKDGVTELIGHESAQFQEYCKYIVNVGSVGQPRDGDPRAAYCVYDTDTAQIDIRRVAYPVKKAQNRIRQAGLPSQLADRLSTGT